MRKLQLTYCNTNKLGSKINIEIGSKYGKLTVIGEGEKFIQPSGQSQRGIICQCECGNIKRIRLSHLRTGRVISCFCDAHGDTGTQLHNSWRAMRNRCNPNYFESHLYYDKGVKCCKEWAKYNNFKEWALSNGYKPGLVIDRINGNGNYQPSNCRWVTPAENTLNTNALTKVNYKGKERALIKILYEKGIADHRAAIRSRIKRGWSVDKAIDTPIRKGNYQNTV